MSIISEILQKTPKGTAILIDGEMEAYPEVFALQIIKNALDLNKKVIYASFHPRSRKVMQTLGIKQSENFVLIEMNFGQEIVAKYSCSSQLYEINITLRNIRKELKPDIIIVESLTSLMAYNEVKDVIKFFMESIEESVKFNTIEFYFYDSRTQPENTSKFLNAISNGLMKLTVHDSSFMFHICKIVGTDFIHSNFNYDIFIDRENYWNSKITFNGHKSN